MKTLFLGLLSGILVFISPHLLAVTVTAIPPGGDWSDAGTWDGPVPGCYDTIIIPAGAVVDVDEHIDLTGCPPVWIQVEGELHFVTGKKLDLPCGSAVFMDPGPPPGTLTKGGGGGSSNLINICGVTVWKAADGDLTGPTILCIACALPIELISFIAEPDKQGVRIEWVTASEINNDYFQIERSEDGEVWAVIAQIDGAGTTSLQQEYYELDREPLIGISYYRLEQTDFDGRKETFNPVAVSISHSFDDVDLLIFPNPNDGNQFSVYVPGEEGDPIDVMIYTANGKVVFNEIIEVSAAGLIVVRLDGLLEAGTYIFSSKGRVARLIIE
jgi:hypothetical protein